jgi:hypothetical protein
VSLITGFVGCESYCVVSASSQKGFWTTKNSKSLRGNKRNSWTTTGIISTHSTQGQTATISTEQIVGISFSEHPRIKGIIKLLKLFIVKSIHCISEVSLTKNITLESGQQPSVKHKHLPTP